MEPISKIMGMPSSFAALARAFTVGVALLAAPAVLADAGAVKVAAVVGDQAISSVDVQDRINLVMVTTGIPDTMENRARIAPQILRQLIDEKLQMQDASASNITISDEKLHAAISQIEKQNNKSPGSLEAYIEGRGASKKSFYDQVRAQAAWVEIVSKKIHPRIRVSDQEVARYVQRRTAAAAASDGGAAQEVQIAVIQLPVDNPKNEASVRKVAEKLADEIRSGVRFEAVASQFSSGSGGGAGEPFWVETTQLDPAIGAVLAKTAKGSVVGPLKNGGGYQLIKLVDLRKKQSEGTAETAVAPPPRVEYAFRQVIITPKQGEKKNAKNLTDIATAIAKTPGPCTDKMVGNASGKGADVNVAFLRRVSTDLPDNVRTILSGLSVGAVSSPVTTVDGIRLFILCERTELSPEKTQEEPARPSDEAIRQAIFTEKLELEAQKYMRNLREQAFVEVRGL